MALFGENKAVLNGWLWQDLLVVIQKKCSEGKSVVLGGML